MDIYSTTTTQLEDPDYNTTDSYPEEQTYFNRSDYNRSSRPFHNRTALLAIFLLIIALIVNSIAIQQCNRYSKVLEQRAYVLSVSINLLEEELLLKYKVLPEDLGFGDLRSTWISDPCYETSMSYYEALEAALAYLESYTQPVRTMELLSV